MEYKRKSAIDGSMVMAIMLLVVLAAASYASASYRHEETITKIIDPEGAGMIRLESMSGDMSVEGEAGRKDVEIVIIKRVTAADEEKAREIADKMGIIITRPENSIDIKTRFPLGDEVKKSIFSLFFGKERSLDIELRLKVPSSMSASLGTANGDIVVSSLAGDAEISSASGDISISEIGGNVIAGTASGDVVIADVSGDAEITSASGDITAHGVGGGLSAESASGDIRLSSITGSLDISSSIGDVTVEGAGGIKYSGISGNGRFTGVRGPVDASAASGNLDFMVIPDGPSDYRIATSSGNLALKFGKPLARGFVLKAETNTGEIKVDLPIEIKRVDRNRIAGIVRDGASKVLLETASGDISIEEHEE